MSDMHTGSFRAGFRTEGCLSTFSKGVTRITIDERYVTVQSAGSGVLLLDAHDAVAVAEEIIRRMRHGE